MLSLDLLPGTLPAPTTTVTADGELLVCFYQLMGDRIIGWWLTERGAHAVDLGPAWAWFGWQN